MRAPWEFLAPPPTGGPAVEPLRVLYPEIAVGGFSRVDGGVAFYSRVRALVAEAGPDSLVVDFGAGRGAFLEDPVAYRRQLRLLRGGSTRVVGIDIDPAVLHNDAVDEAHHVNIGSRLPLADGAVHLVVSDYTFEHVSTPSWVAAELDRVLRPGGWLCVKTPNRRGYIGVAARLVPNRLHTGMLRRLQPHKPPEDTFPTTYLINTPEAFRRWFPSSSYEHFVWAVDTEPAYVGGSLVAARVAKTLFSLTPPPFRSVLFAFLRKR